MKNRVFIVAGGPSLKGFDFSLLKDEDTITVNRSIFYTPNPNYFITSDYTFLKKIDMVAFRSIKTTKCFVINRSYDYLQEVNGRIMDVRLPLVYKLGDFDLLIKSWKRSGIGLTFNEFRNGENSAYCAFQLAVVLGYEKIYLLGLDLVCQGEQTHFHEGYGKSANYFNNKLDEYYEEYIIGLRELKEFKPQVEVQSCSSISRLNQHIKFVDIKELL